MKCEFRDKCTFYDDHISKMPVTAIFYKKQYCDLDFAKCARNITATKLGHEHVPHDLFPCQNIRAKIIIDANMQVSTGSLLYKSDNNESFLENDINSGLSGGESTSSGEIAMKLLKQYNGDIVLALGACYAEVRKKYPGYLYSNEPKPDDEYYDAHLEYVAIRNLIHTLADPFWRHE